MKAVNSDVLDMSLVATPTAPGTARILLDLQLNTWGITGILDDVQLIAGELIANAVQSTPNQAIHVRLTREAGAVKPAVWDSSNALPVAAPITEPTLDDIAPDAHALDPGHDDGTGGWGLPLIHFPIHRPRRGENAAAREMGLGDDFWNVKRLPKRRQRRNGPVTQ